MAVVHGANTSDDNDVNAEETMFPRPEDRAPKSVDPVSRADVLRAEPDGPALLRMLDRFAPTYEREARRAAADRRARYGI